MNTKIKNSKHLNILGNDNSLSNREILTASLKRWWQKFGYFSMFTALPALSFAQEAQAEETKKPETPVGGQNVRLLERLNKNRKLPKFLQSRSNYRLPFEKGENNIVSELTGGDNCPGTPIPGGNYTSAAPFTDSGDTTGANNTVGLLEGGFYYNDYSAGGPDHIYSFRITGFGANPQIQVSATSATYRPMIYLLLEYANQGCPSGTNNSVYNWSYPSFAPSPGGTATISLNGFPLNTRLYLFIDSETSGANDAGSYTLRMQNVTVFPAVPATPTIKRFDFDGDSRADVSVFRPSDRVWYLNRSTQGLFAGQFGLATDKITPADFDGDSKTDLAVFRDGFWYWINSSTNYYNSGVSFGLPNDIPVPADYTGDRRAELAVYRDGVWWMYDYFLLEVSTIHFGLPTDKPVPADYDGDGRADQAVYRNGEWHLNRSSQGYAVIQWGLATDKPVPEDYDGDGKTDLAVYRDGTWYILQSSGGTTQFQWGIASDIPVPADYDGDGRVDAAVFRDGVWYLRQSTNGISVQNFGLTNDKPVPAAYLP